MSTEFEQANWATDAFKPAMGKTVVTFKKKAIRDNKQSEDQQREVFKDIDVIVYIPADQFLRPEYKVTLQHKLDYPAEWAAYQRTQETRVLGTPLEMWYSVTESQKAEFRAMGVHTIEQFAGLPDSWGLKIMGFNELRQKAQVFVNSGKDAELVSKIKAESNARVTELETKLAAMAEQLAALTAPEHRGPGRPKKSVEE